MQLNMGKYINAEMELKVNHDHNLLNEELDDVSGNLNKYHFKMNDFALSMS